MHQQGLHQEGLLRLDLARAEGAQQRAEVFDEGVVGGGDRLQVPALAHQLVGGRPGHPVQAARGQRHHAIAQAAAVEDVAQRRGVVGGAQQHARIQRPVARPRQLPAQVVRHPCVERGGQHHHLPGAAPALALRLEDAPPRRREAAHARRGEAVVAAPADLPRLQPVVLHQPIDAGAHHALVEPEGRHQPDQVGQPHHAAVHRDQVAIHRDDQRVGADAPSGEVGLDPAFDHAALHAFWSMSVSHRGVPAAAALHPMQGRSY